MVIISDINFDEHYKVHVYTWSNGKRNPMQTIWIERVLIRVLNWGDTMFCGRYNACCDWLMHLSMTRPRNLIAKSVLLVGILIACDVPGWGV